MKLLPPGNGVAASGGFSPALGFALTGCKDTVGKYPWQSRRPHVFQTGRVQGPPDAPALHPRRDAHKGTESRRREQAVNGAADHLAAHTLITQFGHQNPVCAAFPVSGQQARKG